MTHQTDAWNGTCPRCGSARAYEGFSKWECPKDGCDFFSAKQKKLVGDELELRAKIQKEYNRDTQPGENLELDLEQQDDSGPPDDVYLDAVAYGYGMFVPPAPPPTPPPVGPPPPPPPAKDSDTDDNKQENDDDLAMYPYDLADLPDLNLD